MIIDCISDLHGEYPTLEGGDLLIIAGDITGSDRVIQWGAFFDWFCATQYRKRILIAGNHDRFLQQCILTEIAQKMGFKTAPEYEYLCDSGCEFEGLRIWGSPWTRYFSGINPHCTAFTCHHDITMAEKWAMIPKDTDILITHCPPYGIMDKANVAREHNDNYGCKHLLNRVMEIRPRLHVFGHIHAGYGTYIHDTYINTMPSEIKFINAAQMDENYNMTNKPIRVLLP